MSKCPWPHSAVRITFASPDSAQRLASSTTEASACVGSGAGMIPSARANVIRSEEHTSELQSHVNFVCRLLREKKNDSFRFQVLSFWGNKLGDLGSNIVEMS